MRAREEAREGLKIGKGGGGGGEGMRLLDARCSRGITLLGDRQRHPRPARWPARRAGRLPVVPGFHHTVPHAGAVQLVGPFLRGTRCRPGIARKTALLATIFAAIALLIAALLGETLLASYGIPLDVLRLSGGVVLFLVAIRTVLEQFAAPEPPADEVALDPQAVMKLAMRPLAFPGIVTPYGIAALVVFLAFSQSVETRLTIAAVVVAVMALNLVFMLAARRLQVVFALALPVLGAVLGVVQVALGLQIINIALRALRAI